MKKILFLLSVVLLAGFAACKKSDFAESYPDPSKIPVSSMAKQFAGVLTSYTWSHEGNGRHGYVVPSYWNYFVVVRPILHFTQATGWQNADNQYVPGAASITDRWNDYYFLLAQYRELENIYSKLSPADQEAQRIFMIAATIFFYDQTQKVVDLHGDIPWSEAGKLSANGGDYQASLPKYDDAASIYTKMLDDLKALADELNTINVPDGMLTSFKQQDLINWGDLTMWKRYCNSLRLRMLTRVTEVPAFQTRVVAEIDEIINNPGEYPVVTSNAENIKVNVFDPGSEITARGFRTGLEDWNGNLAGKAMIDHMNANGDPRLRVMFEPGAEAGGIYTGLDPLMNRTTQGTMIADGEIAIYNRSTFSRNEYFPGVLITAAQVGFYMAEYYVRNSLAAEAKTAYERGIEQSIEFYYWLRTLSNDNTAGPVTAPNASEINDYLNSDDVDWDQPTDKLSLLATQKWIHYSIIQPVESWSEIRRLDAPSFSFEIDNANQQSQPPLRWIYPAAEQVYNARNYEAVASRDKLNTPIFWDID